MWSDNETDRDLLGFKVHADLIKSVITNERILPVSIGVFGDWGSGKSSIMKMLDKELNADGQEDTACLYFNGWTFEGYDDAKAALIEDILIKLQENKKFGHKVKDETTKLLKSVNWLRAGGFLMKNVARPALLAYATGGASLIVDVVDKAKDFFGNTVENSAELLKKIDTDEGKGIVNDLKGVIEKNTDNDIPTVVRKFREDFEKTIGKTGLKSLVILIDDLDRCNPERIIDNLEAIKLFLNVPKTAFVIGADERIVRHAIECRYKTPNIHSTEIEQYKGIVTDYLEKLIQVPYRLPRLSNADVETYMTLLFCFRDLSEGDFDAVYTEFVKFRENDRHSSFNYEKVKALVKGKKNAKQKDVEQQLLMVKQIAPMVTDGLKGNPRQIKRFLNTFTLRLELAEVAKFDVDERILAKLMVLEYIALGRFKDLCDWQQMQNGKPKQIAELENYANNPKDRISSELSGWDESIILKWARMEPSLKDVSLMDYYWIARDKLANTIDAESMVSQIIRLTYKSITTYTTKASLKVEIQKIADLQDDERNVLLGMIGRDMMEHPDNDRCFEITHAIIDAGYAEMIEIYKNTLQRLCENGKDSVIPASVAIGMKTLGEKDANFKAIIENVNKSTRLAKALGIQIKKQ
ncbi:MAG: P-loop NTPase fold protein [Proteiniphilum sp.]